MGVPARDGLPVCSDPTPTSIPTLSEKEMKEIKEKLKRMKDKNGPIFDDDIEVISVLYDSVHPKVPHTTVYLVKEKIKATGKKELFAVKIRYYSKFNHEKGVKSTKVGLKFNDSLFVCNTYECRVNNEHIEGVGGVIYGITKMKFYPLGSLGKYIHRSKYPLIDERRIWQWAWCLTSGVGEIHKKHIIHRGIRGLNMLLDGENGERVVLVGFGGSRDEITTSSQIGGGPMYAAPEEEKEEEEEGVNAKTDVWRIGCAIYEILVHRFPVLQGMTVMQRLDQNLPKGKYSKDIVNLVIAMMELKASDRPTVTQARIWIEEKMKDKNIPLPK